MNKKPILFVALLAVLAMAVSPAFAAPIKDRAESQTVTHNATTDVNGTDIRTQGADRGIEARTAAHTAELSLELLASDSAWSSGQAISQQPTVMVSQNITFAGGEEYRIVVQDEDAGGSISVTPPENAVWNATNPIHAFVRNGNGSVISKADVWGPAEIHKDLAASVEGDITQSGIVNQSVALVDVQTAETVAETDPQPYLVGYNQSASVTKTRTRLEFSVPRAPFPSDAELSLRVYNASSTFREAEVLPVEMTYDAQLDAFVGDLQKDRLSAGNYSYRLQVDHPTGITVDHKASHIDPSFSPIEINEGEVSNSPPEPALSWSPTKPSPDEPITFNASESTDFDGTIVEYQWDLDGDGQIDTTGQLSTQTHGFDSAGEHNVALTLVDDDGATASTTDTVTVTSLDRFDQYEPHGRIGFRDVLNAINGFNSNRSIGGVSVSFEDVLAVIEAYNRAS